jgi:hypothetical protein
VGFEPTWLAPIRFRGGAVMTASVPLLNSDDCSKCKHRRAKSSANLNQNAHHDMHTHSSQKKANLVQRDAPLFSHCKASLFMKIKLENFVMLLLLACITAQLTFTSASFAYGGIGCGGMSGHAPTGFGGTRGGGGSYYHVVENREKILIELNARDSASQRIFHTYKDTLPCIKTINKAERSYMQPANTKDSYLSLIKNYSLQVDPDQAFQTLAQSAPKSSSEEQIRITFPTQIGDCSISGNGNLPWKICTPKGQWNCYSIELSKDLEHMLSRRQKHICPKIQTALSEEFLNELHRKTVARNADRIVLQVPLETKDALINAAELAPHRDQIIISMRPVSPSNIDQILWCMDIKEGKVDPDWQDFQHCFAQVSSNARSLEWLQQWKRLAPERTVAVIAGYKKDNPDACYVDQRLEKIWQAHGLSGAPSCGYILLSRGAQVGVVLSSNKTDKVLCLVAKPDESTHPHAISEAEEAADIMEQHIALVCDKHAMPEEIERLDAMQIWTQNQNWPLTDAMLPLSGNKDEAHQ